MVVAPATATPVRNVPGGNIPAAGNPKPPVPVVTSQPTQVAVAEPEPVIPEEPEDTAVPVDSSADQVDWGNRIFLMAVAGVAGLLGLGALV